MRFKEKEYEKFTKMLDTCSSYSEEALDDKTLTPYERYKKAPIIYKNQIINNYGKIASKEFMDDYENVVDINTYLQDVTNLSSNHDRIHYGKSGKKWILETTTGSTGKPFTVVKSVQEKLLESKYLFDQRKQFYKEVTPDNGLLLMQPVDKFIKSLNYRGNTADNVPLIIDYMLETRPKWLLTTTLLLRKIVAAVKEKQLEDKVKDLHLLFIETTSQALNDDEKVAIEDIFGCKVVNQFGCREVWNIAYECPCGKMHINDKYLMVDIVDNDGKIIEKNGEVGDVIISSFIHKTFPLLKYYLGDHAYFSGEECECGNKSPVIVFCGGRQKDKLLGTDIYGTEIFRKIMRFIYFKHPELGAKDVAILQKNEKDIEVKAFLTKGQEEEFKKYFIDTFNFLVPKHEFNFEYLFLDEMINDINAEKPEIFKNYHALKRA